MQHQKTFIQPITRISCSITENSVLDQRQDMNGNKQLQRTRAFSLFAVRPEVFQDGWYLACEVISVSVNHAICRRIPSQGQIKCRFIQVSDLVCIGYEIHTEKSIFSGTEDVMEFGNIFRIEFEPDRVVSIHYALFEDVNCVLFMKLHQN